MNNDKQPNEPPPTLYQTDMTGRELIDELERLFVQLPADNLTQAMSLVSLLQIISFDDVDPNDDIMRGYSIVLTLIYDLVKDVRQTIINDENNPRNCVR